MARVDEVSNPPIDILEVARKRELVARARKDAMPAWLNSQATETWARAMLDLIQCQWLIDTWDIVRCDDHENQFARIRGADYGALSGWPSMPR